jgi:acyl-CoA synthetase (AMP-forming)/AMP-acid ligase II
MSAGRTHPFVRIALLDDNDRITTEPGIRGEIVAQGETVMKGYYKNPDANAQARFGEWHKTGDVGVFSEDGYLTLVDRKKDMIITGGFNVYSTEVEAALMAHPAVKDCAVIGVPDEKWGEAVKGIVELRPGSEVDEETLRAFVKDKLGSVKTPKTVDIVAQLPRSPVGKVLKKDLRERFWIGRDRAI